jgi:hypothetical protein
MTANDGLGKAAVARVAAIKIAEICFFITPSTKLKRYAVRLVDRHYRQACGSQRNARRNLNNQA